MTWTAYPPRQKSDVFRIPLQLFPLKFGVKSRYEVVIKHIWTILHDEMGTVFSKVSGYALTSELWVGA